MSLWDWAVTAYAAPGVAEACLELQDSHGQNTCFLLWAAWSGAADSDLLARAAETAKGWETAVLVPMRAARRALKAPAPLVTDAAREALREEVKAAELAAERVLLDALGQLAPARRNADALQALRTAVEVWGEPPPLELLARLAQALSAQLYGQRRGAHQDRRPNGGAQMLDDAADEAEPALRTRLAALKQEHADLDTAVQAMAGVPLPDLLAIGRLKRKKLQLKDEIARIEDLLTPDIIA